MNVLDYTVSHYERLLDAALRADREFLTVREYLETQTPPDGHVVLRHDVDRKVENALTLARLEAERGVAATYYFRTSTFDPEVVTEIADLGHEVGYHYEDLAATRGDRAAAKRRFAENLTEFREVADVKTVCAHGSPLSAQHNPDLWDGRLDELAEYGVLGEAYLSIDVESVSDLQYLSDTGRTWHAELPGVGLVETTSDLIIALGSDSCPNLYVLAHPSRWTRSRAELAEMVAWDVTAEIAKSTVDRVHALVS